MEEKGRQGKGRRGLDEIKVSGERRRRGLNTEEAAEGEEIRFGGKKSRIDRKKKVSG